MAFTPDTSLPKFFTVDDDKVAQAAQHFKDKGWVRVADFLHADVAERMYNYLMSHLMPAEEWWHSSQHAEAVGTQFVQAVPKNLPTIVANRAHAAERKGNHLHYSFTRTMHQATACPNPTFQQFFDLMSEERLRDMVHTITGIPGVTLETLFASKYVTGDFLDGHTDAIPDSRRALAFVLNLSKHWQAEYGGNLHMDGHTLVPTFNSLILFDVRGQGRHHWVSPVTDKTDQTRLAISGWLQA